MILTNSEIACFQRCQREWSHRYVERRTGPSTDAQSRGTRIHAWLSAWWSRSPIEAAIDTLEPVEFAMVQGYHARYGQPHLRDIEVNVPISVELHRAGVTLVGELDAIGTDERGNTILVEHKSTTQDISPGSQYWSERVSCDPQVSTYLRAFPRAVVLYDVLRVPALRPLEANTRRKIPETDEEYVQRCLAAMAEKPDYYFQRGTIVRLEHETEAFERDVEIIAESMHPGPQARNPKACFSFGKRCDFFGVCWSGESLDTLQQVEKNHSEQVLERVQEKKRRTLPIVA